MEPQGCDGELTVIPLAHQFAARTTSRPASGSGHRGLGWIQARKGLVRLAE
ncbi:MAG: hypothetical protein R2715_10335 [Ilumatobacteraceae bacterium]